MTEHGDKINENDVEEMVQEYDVNNDGHINSDEFNKMMKIDLGPSMKNIGRVVEFRDGVSSFTFDY